MIGVDCRIPVGVFGFVLGILRRKQNILVVDTMAKLGKVGDVGGRRWSQIENGEPFGAFEQTR